MARLIVSAMLIAGGWQRTRLGVGRGSQRDGSGRVFGRMPKARRHPRKDSWKKEGKLSKVAVTSWIGMVISERRKDWLSIVERFLAIRILGDQEL